MNEFLQYENLIPLIAPVDTAATAISTPYVDLKTAHEANFLILFGAITTGTADSNVTVTVDAATVAAGTGAAAIGFTYRLSSAVGADAWGDAAAAASTGLAIASTDDNKALYIYLDPAAVQAAKADARWVRVTITPTADHTVTLLGAVASLKPRYKANSMVSAT